MMTAAVEMITESMKVIIMSMSRMNAAVVMRIITMSMRRMNRMNVAAAMSIIMAMNTTFRGIRRIVNAKFAILMRSIAIFVAKA